MTRTDSQSDSFGPTRRQFLKGAAATMTAISLLGDRAFADGASSKPNIIILNADDMGYGDLGVYGTREISTPNLDKMARDGVRFTDFYAPASVCTPSRAGLMTGRYAVRSGLTEVLFPNDKNGLNNYEITIGQAMKERGYTTACVGKWHLGCLPQQMPTLHGFDHFYGIPYSHNMGALVDGYPNVPLVRNTEVIEKPAHTDLLTSRYAEEVIRFVKANKQKPFFAYLGYAMPHTPWYVSERFRGKSKHGLYGDTVEEIDWSVGEILKALKQEGLDKNTIVMFTSDNGPVIKKGVVGGSAGPLRGSKGTVWEGGQREPFIAYWPGHIKAGSVCHEPASHLDLLPTCVALAGGKAPSDRIIDGRNIRSLLTSPGARKDDYPFFYIQSWDVNAVRYGKWKLHVGDETKPLPEPELYDLKADIGETKNLAKQFPDMVAKLQSMIQDFKKTMPEAPASAAK